MAKTVYKGKQSYVEIDTELHEKTGEVKIISEPFTADNTETHVDRKGFEITYLAYFCDLFDKLGGQKYKVFKYIIEHKSYDNTLIITIRELALKSKVSLKTAHEALKLLREQGLIKTKSGSIMLLPKLSHRGDGRKEAWLMRKFVEFDEYQGEQLNLHAEGGENDVPE